MFANVMNAAVRLLTGRLPEATLVRLDTDAVTFALYVGGHAILGAVVGVAIALATARRLSGPARPPLIAAAILAIDVLVLSRLWAHRSLAAATGIGLVAMGALAGAVAASLLAAPLRRLTSRTLAALATLATGGVLLGGAVVLLVAARGPRPPAGDTLAEPTRDPTGVSLAILALDGLDGRLVDAAIAEGRLPNLAALTRRGVRGDLRSIRPPKSPVVWTSAVTGVLPGVHGITDFVVHLDGERVPVTSNLRRVPALWNLAEDLGFDCAFVNWYVTWPAEPTRGVMISDRVDLPGLAQRVFPEDLTGMVDSVRAAVDAKSERDIERFTRGVTDFAAWRAERWGQVRRSLRILDDVVRHDLITLETARALLGGAPQPDLTALYFRGNDNTQHLFWKYRLADRGDRMAGTLFSELPAEDVEALAQVVDRYYDFVDAMVGEAVAMLDPDTALLVLSDHGFLTNNERSRWFHANRLLAEGGFAKLRPGSGGAADSATSVVWDPVEPTVDARRLLRAGGAADSADDALLRARDFLDGLRTDAGEPLFVSTALGEDEFGPRLAIVFARSLDGSSALVNGERLPKSEFHIPEGHSGDHRMNGFLLAAGGPFREGERVHGARVVDIAPTVLHLLGAPVARDMEGVALTGLLRPEWNGDHPVRSVGSYGERSAENREAIATDADELIRAELRALGYLQ